jgi:hypothetical protein
MSGIFDSIKIDSLQFQHAKHLTLLDMETIDINAELEKIPEGLKTFFVR